MLLSNAGYIAYQLMLRNWRERVGLSDAVLRGWRDELDDGELKRSLQWLERGGRRELVVPSIVEFLELSELNRRIACGELGGLSDQMRSALKDLRPIADDDGRVWDWASLIACYLGDVDIPRWLAD